jgi:hypothetical protein
MALRKVTSRFIGASVVMCFVGACAANGPVYVPPPPADDNFRFRVSEGHMPRPGECRIWYPNVPPGNQSPPGRCIELERQVPPGAILVRG